MGKRICIQYHRAFTIVAHNWIGCLKEQGKVDRIDVVDAKNLQRQAVG